MNLKFRPIFLFITLSAVVLTTRGNEYVRKKYASYANNEIADLVVSNKFGSITINDTKADSVTVLAKITVDASSQQKADEVLKQIKIEIGKSGKTLQANTILDDNFKTKTQFTINYIINIPADRPLTISNKYGNVTLNQLKARGAFEIKYGNLDANQLLPPPGSQIALDLGYGNAEIKEVTTLTTELKYSKLYSNKIDALTIDSKYSEIGVGVSKTIRATSKYDRYMVEQLGSLESESKYTNYKIKQLDKKLVLDNGYGTVDIDKVNPDFEQIRVISSYGTINIGLGSAAYRLVADCEYCGISYPQNSFSGNKSKEDHSIRLDGKVNGGSQQVSISSKYGEIRLNE